jgi:hypothetical protein
MSVSRIFVLSFEKEENNEQETFDRIVDFYGFERYASSHGCRYF